MSPGTGYRSVVLSVRLCLAQRAELLAHYPTMHRTITSALLLSVLLMSVLAFATGQEGDIVLLDGKKYFSATYPMIEFIEESLDRLPKSRVYASSSGNRRGYVATWEIKQGLLVLMDVMAFHPVWFGFQTEYGSVMSTLFPSRKQVPADIFTGYVVLPHGGLVRGGKMFENYMILRIERGLVTRTVSLDTANFERFTQAQFASYKKTVEYERALAQEAITRTVAQAETALRLEYEARWMSIIFDDK